MKHLFPSVILLISMTVITTCSHDDYYVWKKGKLEWQLHLVDSASRSLAIKMEDYTKEDIKFKDRLQYLHDSLTKEYENVKLHIEVDWYKGLNRPYENILNNLTKQGYILTDFVDRNFVPYLNEDPDKNQKILSIDLKTDWNMEDVTKIKNIIMKTLPFEPVVNEYSYMTWFATKYDVQMYETGRTHKIRIIFLIK
ncbi:MAG: hypothetical protein MUO72_17210 [Bacteroidales bacterium]|nr:hypothetical protein [Bacteroidales bacterium]